MRSKSFQRATALLILTLIPLSLAAGCSKPAKTPELTADGFVVYDTENSTDANNYTVYTNKEIILVMNILSAHMSNADNLNKDKYILDDELNAVIKDRDKVAEAIASVEGLNPPNDYEDDREAILERMVNADSTLEAYQDALENEETDFQDYIDLMEGDFTSLSALCDLPWE